jgi:predicted acyl esterase
MMKLHMRLRVVAILVMALSAAAPLAAQDRQAVDEQRRKAEELRDYIKANYTKTEYIAPMRDGIHLFVAVYAPKDHSKQYPIWMQRPLLRGTLWRRQLSRLSRPLGVFRPRRVHLRLL